LEAVRVLLVHNHYGSSAPSGENRVFEREKALLERRGHDVHVFTRHSDELLGRGLVGALVGGAATAWNPLAARAVRDVATRVRARVVHVHNSFPLISPAAFWALRGCAARVLTLHNYRLFCPAAIPLRGGRSCTECIDGRSVLPALRNACYRKSRVATVPLAVSVALHRAVGTWQREVEAFIALSEFQRELMIRGGLPRDRVWVKPNFHPGRPRVVPWGERRDCVVFAGRLTPEKGLVPLVEAWLAWGESAPELRIVGEGPLRAELERRVRSTGCARVVFVGALPQAEAEREIAQSRLIVVPSVWFEGFPLVLGEALACGTPAAVSDIGPLSTIVEDGRTGLVFGPNDASSLLAVVRAGWSARDRLASMSAAARAEYERTYSEDANYTRLMEIYEVALRTARDRAA
jgi:glycosyltransferase involved in cell wall biosynthesis